MEITPYVGYWDLTIEKSKLIFYVQSYMNGASPGTNREQAFSSGWMKYGLIGWWGLFSDLGLLGLGMAEWVGELGGDWLMSQWRRGYGFLWSSSTHEVWISKNREFEEWKKKNIRRLLRMDKEIDFKNWIFWERIKDCREVGGQGQTRMVSIRDPEIRHHQDHMPSLSRMPKCTQITNYHHLSLSSASH